MISGQHLRLGQLLAEMEAEAGPIPPDVLQEARQLWGVKPKHPDRGGDSRAPR